MVEEEYRRVLWLKLEGAPHVPLAVRGVVYRGGDRSCGVGQLLGGEPAVGAQRTAFLFAGLRSLEQDLRQLGSQLIDRLLGILLGF